MLYVDVFKIYSILKQIKIEKDSTKKKKSGFSSLPLILTNTKQPKNIRFPVNDVGMYILKNVPIHDCVLQLVRDGPEHSFPPFCG